MASTGPTDFSPSSWCSSRGFPLFCRQSKPSFAPPWVINATLHVATGVLVGLVVNTVLSECSALVRYIASLVAGAVYLLGWNLFWVNLTLKENSLATFLYVLAILCLLRALSTQRERSPSDHWIGCVARHADRIADPRPTAAVIAVGGRRHARRRLGVPSAAIRHYHQRRHARAAFDMGYLREIRVRARVAVLHD